MEKHNYSFSFLISVSIILLSATHLNGAGKFHNFTIKLKNPLPIERYDELIVVPSSDIKEHFKNFDESNFIIKSNGISLPYDLDTVNNKFNILFQVNFKPGELKQITFSYSNKKPVFHNTRSQAYLGIKKNYKINKGIYTAGNFESTSRVIVPKNHFPHDALYQMEGPAWESDKVAYRFYLDERNRTDIFGKSTNKLVLDKVGEKDLLSGDESYEYPLWWGQDIFKVGTSLGIGSIATYSNNKVITVSGSDSILCSVSNKNVYSSVTSDHYGWNVENIKFNISTNYTIIPGSRLTQVNVKTDKPLANFCTGLAKHDSTVTLFSKNNYGWQYVANWGKQTICNDHLGIALFYNYKDMINLTDDKVNQIVVLKPFENQVKYYFAAAWEKEQKGIKTQRDFQLFLNQAIECLNNPIIVYLNQ